MKIIMLTNVKMPTNVGILTFISMIEFESQKNLYFSAFKFLSACQKNLNFKVSVKNRKMRLGSQNFPTNYTAFSNQQSNLLKCQSNNCIRQASATYKAMGD